METNGGLENTSVNKGDFAAGEILCMTTWRGFFGEYESMLSTYGENYYFIGYPTERGNGTFISADLGIAVNANTKNLDVVDIKADAIRAIILEETEPMLSGTKSPEETAKVIQSRVSLYLMERQ